MKSITNSLILFLSLFQGMGLYAQNIDSTQVDSVRLKSRTLQSANFMAVPMALPALPNINYTIPPSIPIGQSINYFPVNSGGAVFANGDVFTVAGSSGSSGYANGSGATVRFNLPGRMVADALGNIYVCDHYNHRIRKITPDGVVSTFVGSGSAAHVNGTGEGASIHTPNGIARDASGNFYFSDRGNFVVRKISSTGVVTALAGGVGLRAYAEGTGTAARFNALSGMVVDASGNVYVADEGNLRIRKITPSGVVSTFAGNGSSNSVNGTGTSASFYGMKGLAIDASGNIYVAEYQIGNIRKITPSGVVTTLATGFNKPMGITVDPSGNVYVTDLSNRVSKITPAGAVSIYAGTGSVGSENGNPLSSSFSGPEGVLYHNNRLYIGDTQNHLLRGSWSDIGYSISPALPAGLVFDKSSGKISGTPTAAKAATSYTITAYNAAGSSIKVISFAVVAAGIGSSSQNYILERTVRNPNYKTTAALEGKPVDSVNIKVQFIDGLGRPLQVVDWQGSPLKNDIVQHIGYDGFGRESVKYLPYAQNNVKDGSYKTAAATDQLAYYAETNTWDSYIKKTPNPYSVTVFENSPLNRVQQQGSPGEAWQPAADRSAVVATSATGHTVVSDYGTNAADDVKMWSINDTENGATSAFYAAGKLYKTVIKDENWVGSTGKLGTVEEYKDFEGRIVLKRVWETDTKKLETHYVYDDFGDLRYVIPPGYTATTVTDNNTDFNELLYAYKYDGRRRLIEKKIPGKGWEYLVYNKNDQLILNQDANQRDQKKWSYTKYDPFGRVASSGIYTNVTANQMSRAEVQALADAVTPQWETRSGTAYTNSSFPNTVAQLQELTVNYYDDYSFKTATILAVTNGLDSTSRVKGLLTGTRVSMDDGTSPLLTVNYYDDYGRVIQTAADNHIGGTDYVTNTYSFVGELKTSIRLHKDKAGTQTTTVASNEYDHVGRLLATTHHIGDVSNAVTLTKNEYNEIGQLKKNSVGGDKNGANFHSAVDYAYNERGWTSSASSAQFSYALKYNEPTLGKQYNGNISEQHWAHSSPTLSNVFKYSYDGLNRLKNGTSTGTIMIEDMAYDDMGNITVLKRNVGNTTTLTTTSYAYNNANKSNRLLSVTGGVSGTYTYDLNGNAKTDRTGMNFNYNHLNLPDSAWNAGSTVKVGYLYDALGTKLRKYSTQGGNRDYVGGIEYNGNTIELIHTGAGVAYRNSNGTYTYRYNLTDHLGNVRSTVYRNPANNLVEVLQKDDYYPFGKQRIVAAGNNKYLYNGKETQSELGGQYDYGARFYDAEIGRWNVVDPLAEQMRKHSPYNYAFNNPIRFIDPDGMAPADTLYSQNAQERTIVPNKGTRVFMQHGTGDFEYNGKKYIQVNSKVSIIGDPREITRGNEQAGFEGNLEDFTPNLDGVLNRAFKNVKGNALSMALESGGGGELDFMKDFKPGVLYNINGIYYNNHEALNYVWGAALKKAGMPLSTPSVLKEGFHMAWNKTLRGNEPEHNIAINRGYHNQPGRPFKIYTIPQIYNEKTWLRKPIGK